MYLLTAGETANVINSLNNLSEAKILLILSAIPITLISIYFFIKKLNITKAGPFERMAEQQKKIMDEQSHRFEVQNQAIYDQHQMDKKNDEHDDHLKERCQDRTNNMRLYFQNELSGVINDPLAVSAVCVHFRSVFSNAIIKNHFTSELKPERYTKYRERILNDLKAEYGNLVLRSSGEQRLPPHEVVDGLMEKFLDSWIAMVKDEVVVTCHEKIKIYKQFIPKFNGVPKLKEAIEGCMNKNLDYIRLFSM